MVSPMNPIRKGSKLVYSARKIRVTPASELWPNRTDTTGVSVLVGEYYVHDEWLPLRSSMVVDIQGKDYETRNSIYHSID